MLVACDSKSEAAFVVATLNSAPSNLVIQSYGVDTQLAPHLLQNVAIPKFNPKNPTHQTLANLSHRCHEAAANGQMDKVAELETEIDEAATELWGITHSELRAIQNALREMEKPKRKRKNKVE